MPMSSFWTAKVGSRVDFYNTGRRGGQHRSEFLLPSDLEQDDLLYAFFWTNELELDCNWTLTGGFGHGQRAPTLIERYSDGLFLGIAQSGFTRVIGEPALAPERDWQADLGLQADYDYWRARAACILRLRSTITSRSTATSFEDPPFVSARLFRYIKYRRGDVGRV